MMKKSKQVRDIRIFPEAGYGWAPKRYENIAGIGIFPLHISPHDHNKVYVGSQYVHVTTSKGQKWDEMSPDLTLNIKSHQEKFWWCLRLII